MHTETVTITHDDEGIRITWPNGEQSDFVKPAQLAEAYALAILAKDHARFELVEDAATLLNSLDDLVKHDDEDLPEARMIAMMANTHGELRKLREVLTATAKTLE